MNVLWFTLFTGCRVAVRSGSTLFYIEGVLYCSRPRGGGESDSHTRAHFPERVDHWVCLTQLSGVHPVAKGHPRVGAAPPPGLEASVAPLTGVLFAFMCLLLRDACLLLAQLHLA